MALRSATGVAARLLDQGENLGTLAAGHFADLIAVKQDPLRDISVLQRVDFVMKGGLPYQREH